MFSRASSAQGPYRRSEHRRRRLTTFDVGGLAIMLALLASGVIPVIGALTSGDVTSGSAHLGFVVVLGSLLLIVRELWLAHRARAEEARSTPPSSPETHDD
jgi:hypothetical protein